METNQTELSVTHRKGTGALALMAERLNVEPTKLLSTLKNTVFKGATDDELLALVVVANTYNLSPILKEIYAFPNKAGGIVPVVSIDGWIHMANSHPQMDGIEFRMIHDDLGKLDACECIIYRKDRGHPVKVTEFLNECRRNTDPWKMEHRMLRHKALIQCVRVAFGFGGVHDEDEARDITERVTSGRTVTAGPDLTGMPKAVEVKPVPAPTTIEVVAEPLTLTGESSPREILRDCMAEANMTLGELKDIVVKAKLDPGKWTRMADMPEPLVSTITKNWSDVLDQREVAK